MTNFKSLLEIDEKFEDVLSLDNFMEVPTGDRSDVPIVHSGYSRGFQRRGPQRRGST